MIQKVCTECQTSRTLEEYYKDSKGKFGKQAVCKFCKREFEKKRYLSNATYYKSRARIRRLEKPEECSSAVRRWVTQNRAASKLIKERWRQNNLGKVAAKEAKRRATKLSATPSWANLEAIKNVYENCPKGYHVDHIVPLKGIEVCGLHVSWNLQYLPAMDNIRKGNKLER